MTGHATRPVRTAAGDIADVDLELVDLVEACTVRDIQLSQCCQEGEGGLAWVQFYELGDFLEFMAGIMPYAECETDALARKMRRWDVHQPCLADLPDAWRFVITPDSRDEDGMVDYSTMIRFPISDAEEIVRRLTARIPEP